MGAGSRETEWSHSLRITTLDASGSPHEMWISIWCCASAGVSISSTRGARSGQARSVLHRSERSPREPSCRGQSAPPEMRGVEKQRRRDTSLMIGTYLVLGLEVCRVQG